MRRWQAVLLALVVGSVVLFGMLGLAQDADEIQIDPGLTPTRCWMECPTTSHPCSIYQYSVKVVQGRTFDGVILGPGQYTTSVNIHNPWCHAVKYQVKLALADRNGLQGTITLYSSFTLKADGVTEFDSVGFATLLNAALPTFFEGYFVIQCEEELDVVAVYAGTVDECASHGLSTIETERVPARRVPRGQDLSANISTGAATWMIASVPPNSALSVGAAPTSNPTCSAWVLPSAAGVQWGAQWVGTSGVAVTASTTPIDYYNYEYTFNLCCDFYDARICLRLWSDNQSDVYLNNIHVGSVSGTGNFSTPSITPIWITHGFLVGQNTLRIRVANNFDSESGIMLDGWLCVEAGACP